MQDPLPKEWIYNKDIPSVWNGLLRKIGQLHIEVKTGGILDNPFITDWAHIQGLATRRQEKLPKKYRHKTEEGAAQTYVDSKVPLTSFLQKEA